MMPLPGRFLSLRWRLMGPLLVLWVAAMGLLVALIHTSILERFRALVEQRADVIVAAIYSAAETAREPADLRRFISTLGASRDVVQVILVTGSPPRVLAATDHGLQDSALDALREPVFEQRLADVLQQRKGWRNLDLDARRLEVLEPVLLMGSDGANGRLEDGVLALQLEADSLWQGARSTVVQLSLWLGGILTVVAGLIYLLLARYVLHPAEGIRKALAGRSQKEGGAEGEVAVPVLRRDELGELAAALNGLLTTLRTRNRQLARARDEHLAMLETFPHLAWRADASGACDWFNRAWLNFTGRSLAEEAGYGWAEGVHPDDREACLAAWAAALAARMPLVSEYRLRSADGRYHWIADHGAPLYDEDGVFTGYVGSCYDLQAGRDTARDIARMTKLYQTLSATNKAIVHATDAARLLPEVCRIAVEYGELDLAWIGFAETGETGETVLRPSAAWGRGGEESPDRVPAWSPGPAGLSAGAQIFNGGPACAAGQMPAGAGSFALFPIHGEEGEAGALVLSKAEPGFFDAHTVTLLDEMSADIGFALRNYRRDESLRLAARVFENNSEGIVVVEPDRRVVMINRAFTRLTGFTREDLAGQPLHLFDPERHPKGFAASLREVAARDGLWQGEVWIRGKSGASFPADMSVSGVRVPGGDAAHYVAVFSDISQRKADEARIRFLANHDFLTGLPSRAALADTVAAAIAQAGAAGGKVALCFLDLDRFKNVNDTLGHHVGD
ncbi:PAS domain S-box protein, partial [Zoogloea sp.]|uniref:PAS domain S-box protein n=1 Tax=Zoogloea sp. TaxID=49181 RepID=UPI0014160F60